MESNKILSICIPTYNRANLLSNLLNSISIANINSIIVEICISDNNSSDNTLEIIDYYSKKLPINYKSNCENIGGVRNILEVVKMATGKFVWILGDDDLIIPSHFDYFFNLLLNNQDLDFFFLNSIHSKNISESLDLMLLPNKADDSLLFSKKDFNGVMDFKNMINPDFTFDFLGGIYLSVFSNKHWQENIHIIDRLKLNTPNQFSTLENTFPHLIIFANAFMNSKVFFFKKPFTINLSVARDWAHLYPIVRVLRMNDALDEYKRNGLSCYQFLKCRNSTLKNFFKDYLFLSKLKKDQIGTKVDIIYFIQRILYPYAFLSIFRYFFEKLFFKKSNPAFIKIQ
jgi:glycosyltransferase involved in cell wall biosynthesis